MKKLISIIIILAIVIIGGGLAGGYYYTQSTQYIKTNDAVVNGDMVNIPASQSGQITNWMVNEGDKVQDGDVLGTLKVSQKGKSTNMDIKATHAGTVVKLPVSEGQMVQQGTTLAVTADLSNLRVKANVTEEQLRHIKKGKDVDIYVKAFPGTTFDGKVNRIGNATEDSFSLLPTSNTQGNYTEETKRVPVYITIKNKQGKHLVPGLNTDVRIDR